MPTLCRVVAAASAVGVVLLAGCTGAADPGAGTTAGPGSPPATRTAEPRPTAEPTEPAEPTDEPASPEPTQASDDRVTVTPFITYAGPGTDPATVEVAGFVPEIIEEGGTCTATIPATGMSVEAPAYPDASATSCGLLVLPVPPDGQTVVLTYSSQASTGYSDGVQVTS